MSCLPLLLLLLAAAASAKTTAVSITAAPAPAPPDASGCGPSAPPLSPTPWPEQFHAALITNLTAAGGRLRQIDIYYDWPRGRALDIIRDQLSGAGEPPLRNVQWVNGTSFLFDAASCRAFHFPVGLLPPDWKARNGTYLGRERADGFDCHVWSNFVFARYDDSTRMLSPDAPSPGAPMGCSGMC
ncbi:unnamed protein product [Urochloa humidicola]